MAELRRWLNDHALYIFILLIIVLGAVGWGTYRYAQSQATLSLPPGCCPAQRQAGKQLMEVGLKTLAWDAVQATLEREACKDYQLKDIRVMDDGVLVIVSVGGKEKYFRVGWDFNEVVRLPGPEKSGQEEAKGADSP